MICATRTDKTDKASSEILVNLLNNCDFSSYALTNYINESIDNKTFSDALKGANIAPMYKLKNPFDKASCKPMSILPLLCKVYNGQSVTIY